MIGGRGEYGVVSEIGERGTASTLSTLCCTLIPGFDYIDILMHQTHEIWRVNQLASF